MLMSVASAQHLVLAQQWLFMKHSSAAVQSTKTYHWLVWAWQHEVNQHGGNTNLTACAVQHGFNFFLMLGELFLNSIPFYPYLLGFVGLWTCSYGIWAFINFSSSGKWMYPVSNLLSHHGFDFQCCNAVNTSVWLSEACWSWRYAITLLLLHMQATASVVRCSSFDATCQDQLQMCFDTWLYSESDLASDLVIGCSS